jgi:hypothetical protein
MCIATKTATEFNAAEVLVGKSDAEIIKHIEAYHADDEALAGAAFDVINQIDMALRVRAFPAKGGAPFDGEYTTGQLIGYADANGFNTSVHSDGNQKDRLVIYTTNPATGEPVELFTFTRDNSVCIADWVRVEPGA